MDTVQYGAGRAGAEVADFASRYDRLTILLHWLTAALVIILWGIAQVIDFFPRGEPRIAARSTHIVLGVVLIAVLLVRLFWRANSGRKLPPAAATRGGFEREIAKIFRDVYPLYRLTSSPDWKS